MTPANESAPAYITALPVARWPEFRALRLRALQTEPAAFGQTYAFAADYPDDLWQIRLRDVIEQQAWLVFAEHEGVLVGMIGAFRSDDDRELSCATIWGVFVEETARGRGVATNLVRALLEKLQVAQFRIVRLTVNTGQTAAVRLYQRHDFAIVGQVSAVLGDGQEHPEYIMERALTVED